MASLEPRPISTSRQPVLPRSVSRIPSSNDFQPARALQRVLGAAVEADDFGAAQSAGEAEQQDRPVAHVAQIGRGQRVEHGDEVLGHERLFLRRRPAMGAAHAREHGGDVAVPAIEGEARLGETPDQRGKAAFDGGDRAPSGARGERGDVEADGFGIGERPRLQPLTDAPAEIIAPIGGIGAMGVLRGRGAGETSRGLDKRRQPGGQGGRFGVR